MSQLLSRIIKRAEVVPLSIPGIFKEATTISVSAWVFGDERTPPDIRSVRIILVGASYYPATRFLNLPIMIPTASTQALASTRTPNTRKPFTHRYRSIHMGTHYHKRSLQTAMRLEFPPKAPLGSTKALVRRRVARRGEGMKKGSNEGRGVVIPALRTKVNSLVGRGAYLIDLFTSRVGNCLVKLRRQLTWD